MRWRTWGIVGLLTLASGLGVAIAQDDEDSLILKKEVAAENASLKGLLTEGWGTLPKFRQVGDAQYEGLAPGIAKGKEGLFARTLVLMNQRRYEEALTVVEQLLKKDPGHLAGHRAKVWALTVLKRHEAAMVSAEEMLEIVLKDDKLSGTDQGDLLAFLARIMGYLGGPAEQGSTMELRRASEKRMLAMLSETQQEIFETARDGVLQKFTELSDQKKEKSDKAKQEHDDAREKTLQSIAEARDRDSELAKRLQSDVQRLDSELKSKLSELDSRDSPLRTEMARLNSRYQSIAADLLQVENRISFLQSSLVGERDPNVRSQIQFQIDQLIFTGRRINSDLSFVGGNLQSVKASRAQIAGEADLARGSYARQLGTVQSQIKGIEKREKKAGVVETRTNRSSAPTPGSARSLSAQAGSLSTYDTYPLETERALLLKSLE